MKTHRYGIRVLRPDSTSGLLMFSFRRRFKAESFVKNLNRDGYRYFVIDCKRSNPFLQKPLY